MDEARYPIGAFEAIPPSYEQRAAWIADIPFIAQSLRRITQDLSQKALGSSYRPGGWTIKQIVHHMADNDLNAYIRFKRALTEEEPVASSYREDLWGELDDYRNLPLEKAIALIELIHERFMVLLNGMSEADFQRTLVTDALGVITLDTALQRLIWHNRHHLAQIKEACKENGLTFETIRELLLHKFAEIERRMMIALEQLNDEELNWRPEPSSNSIANLVIHIEGNIHERILKDIAGIPFQRNRDAEFDPVFHTKPVLIATTTESFRLISDTLSTLPDNQWFHTQTVRNKQRSHLDVLMQCAVHFSEHLGQMMYIAKMLKRENYITSSIPRKTHD